MKIRFASPGLILVAACLAACGGAPEERITEAFPVSPAVEAAKTRMLDAAGKGGGDVSKLESELATRLKLRALECAGGKTFGMAEGAATVRAALLSNKACFDAQDEKLLAWIGERRLAMLVAGEALRPLPKSMPKFVAPTFVSSVQFAQRAGVAITSDVGPGAALLDINNGSIIWRGQGESMGRLSSNGRVFATWVRDKGTELRESETGELLVTMKGIMPYQLQWLGDLGLMYTEPGESDGRGKLVFRDLATGLVSDVEGLQFEVDGVLPAAGSADRFWVLQHRRAYELQLERTPAGWKPKLLSERELPGTHSSNAAGITADGKYYLRSEQYDLIILDLATGQVRIENFEPFYIQGPMPTENPDRILLFGFYKPLAGMGREALMYSLSRRTLTPIDPKSLPDRVFFVPSLGHNANIDDHAVELATVSATGSSGAPATVIAARQIEVARAHQARLAAQEQAAIAAGVMPYQRGTMPTTSAASDAPQEVVKGPVAELAGKARIVGVGVYEGKRMPGAGANYASRGGTVQVRVMRTKQPIILVLAAYESVTWVVTADPGAEISAILMSGYSGGQVMGSAAPVYQIGNAYAYSRSDAGALEKEIQHWTGKTLDSFHGKYTGDQFFLRE